MEQPLNEIAAKLVGRGKGILAADESGSTIKKRFEKHKIEDTEENHRRYRQLLFTTPGIEDFISGVILFDETIRQKAVGGPWDGKLFPTILSERGIIPGIKVDQGKIPFQESPGEFITEGLEGLRGRLSEYKGLGARFTKWRNVYVIDTEKRLPSDAAILKNAEIMAEYAKVVQDCGMVPIVEPEVLAEGNHSLYDSQVATTRVLKKVFEKLSEKGVDFGGMLLKPNWVHPGHDLGSEPQGQEVANATLEVLKATVPDEVPGVVFLSGGDTPDDSTKHLEAMNEVDSVPWQLSFSFGRALQSEALEAWSGLEENTEAAQILFVKRAKAASLAREGKLNL